MQVILSSDHRGRSRVEDYIRELHRSGDRSAVATLQRYIELLEEDGPDLGMPQDRILDPKIGLYELRAGNHRIAYGVANGTIYLLEAWRKQGRRAPVQSVDRARRTLLQLRE